jgi:UDP-N-acetylmuramate-alanine ligase
MLSRELADGDVVVVMGAGDVWRVFDSLAFDDEKEQ